MEAIEVGVGMVGSVGGSKEGMESILLGAVCSYGYAKDSLLDAEGVRVGDTGDIGAVMTEPLEHDGGIGEVRR